MSEENGIKRGGDDDEENIFGGWAAFLG